MSSKEPYICTICDTTIPRCNWEGHSKGAKHVRKCTRKGIDPTNYKPTTANKGPMLMFCSSCNQQMIQSEWESHLKTQQHQKRDAIKATLNNVELDKNGVSLQGDFDFDVIAPQTASAGKQFKTGAVTLTDRTAKITLVNGILASSRSGRSSSFSLQPPIIPNQILEPNSTISFSIFIKQAYNGHCQDRIELYFKDIQVGKSFVITRPIRGVVGNKAEHDRLEPKVPYAPPPNLEADRQPEIKVVPGVPPTTLQAPSRTIKIPQAKIPSDLTAALSSGTVGQILRKLKGSFLPQELNNQTHSQHFKCLVWIEENRQEQDMGMYDLYNVKLALSNVAFRLQVPGLAEKRPSVLIGDRIFAQPTAVTDGHWFEGFVHTVEQDAVLIHFTGTFQRGWSKTKLYNVRFKLNRTMIRRQHYVLDNSYCEERILFPTKVHLLTTQHVNATTYPISTVNPDIATNPQQMQAVVAIVNQPRGSPPFIVFGPPGTGKTVTIVEAIRQVLKKDPNAKVFACAPSNSAADLITLRLKDLGNDVVFRFYAPTRQKIEVLDELMSFTYMSQGRFSAPSLKRMSQYRVVISTCGSSISATTSVGMARGSFSHIFVDEAGQASEPELMIAIKTLPDVQTNIILSGDPKQLGPVIRSAVARKLNLEESYLERLMKNGPYDIHSDYGVTIVKLVKNFRSHKSILQFSNERFYENELQACGDARIVDSFLKSHYLSNGKFPVVFHGVEGRDGRDASSPSFFNVDEILVVANYVEWLLADRHEFNITEEDIGVISPYRAQSSKIRTKLREVLDDPKMKIKVDCVEGFQGQERRVIIISTVRSSPDFMDYDLKHTLGFVANPRRFNVASTRAQALLIVVGDPTVLSLDPLWRSFLNYIYNNRGWTGSPITWDPTVPVDEAGGYDKQIRETAASELRDLVRRIEQLTLENVEDGDGNVDRPWRVEE